MPEILCTGMVSEYYQLTAEPFLVRLQHYAGEVMAALCRGSHRNHCLMVAR